MVGWRALEYKERRRQRRRNHVAKDLGSNKYRQRVVPNRRRIDNDDGSYFFEEDYLVDAAWNDE